MIIAVWNASGLDIFLAISASEERIRIVVHLAEPKGVARIEKLRPGEGFGLRDCPEGAKVSVNSARDQSFHVERSRVERVERLDEYGEIDGMEAYRVFTIRLLN